MRSIPKSVTPRTALVLVWALMLAAAPGVQGVVGGSEPSCADTRFDAVGLILTVNNPTVPCSQNISGSCVLIDRQTVLVARHSIIAGANDPLPASGSHKYRVRFRRAPDGRAVNTYAFPWPEICHGVYTQVDVKEFRRAGYAGVDMLIGVLETPIDYITPIAPVTNAASLPGTGAQVILAGWGYQGPCFREGDGGTLMVKRGPLPVQIPGSCCIAINPCSSPSGIGICYSCPAAPVGQSWILPNFLDSGSPILIETACLDPVSGLPKLQVAGVVSTTASGWTTVSWNQYTPNDPLPAPVNVCQPCSADFNHDSLVTISDLFAFLNAWFATQCLADIDVRNSVTVSDLFIYLNEFFGGCQ